jgi:hypothetical protein
MSHDYGFLKPLFNFLWIILGHHFHRALLLLVDDTLLKWQIENIVL